MSYDYLVIATGSKTNYFGNKEIERNSMSMKTIPQSLNIRSLILENLDNTGLLQNAQTLDNECMGIVHTQWPIVGMQFHPEAILSEYGLDLLKNWLDSTKTS